MGLKFLWVVFFYHNFAARQLSHKSRRDDIMVVNKLQISLELRRSDTICSFIFIGQY